MVEKLRGVSTCDRYKRAFFLHLGTSIPGQVRKITTYLLGIIVQVYKQHIYINVCDVYN